MVGDHAQVGKLLETRRSRKVLHSGCRPSKHGHTNAHNDNEPMA